jgi:hypothetical protein
VRISPPPSVLKNIYEINGTCVAALGLQGCTQGSLVARVSGHITFSSDGSTGTGGIGITRQIPNTEEDLCGTYYGIEAHRL